MNKLATIVLVALLFSSCGEGATPKPRGEMRLDYQEKVYTSYTSDCGFSFDKPNYALIEKARSPNNQCWRNIHFPEQKGTIHLTYTEVNGQLASLLNDTKDLTYEHHIKASNIETEVIKRDDANVYGLIYKVSGDVASNAQFYLTDSSTHFVRGALYFQSKPNWDSLQPAIDYVQADIDRLISSLKWSD